MRFFCHLFSAVALLTLSGCCAWTSFCRDLWGKPPSAIVEKKINAEAITCLILEYTTRLHYERHLTLENSLVYYDNEINKIRLEFITQDLLELRDARQLLVDIVEGLLVRLNEDEQVGVDLDFDFTANNLEIYINFESYWGLYGDPMYIGWAVLQNGLTYLYAFDIKNYKTDWWHSRVEPYFKSREIVFCEREAEALYRASLPPPPPTLEESAIFKTGTSSSSIYK